MKRKIHPPNPPMKSEYVNQVDTPSEPQHLGWSGSVKVIHPQFVFDGTLNYSYDKDSTLLPKTPQTVIYVPHPSMQTCIMCVKGRTFHIIWIHIMALWHMATSKHA